MKSLVWAAWILSLFFTLAVGVINLSVADDAPLQGFVLEQADCDLPCWQGIQPDKSDVSTAIRILQNHPWVGEVNPGGPNISWGWSGQQPDYIDVTKRGMLATDWDRVSSVAIPVQLTFGDFMLAFGQPQQDSYVVLRGTPLIAHTAVYPQFALYGMLSCPLQVRRIWSQPVTLIMELRLSERNTNQGDFVDYQMPLWRREMSVCENE